jgi:SET domain-containing protein
VAPGWIGVGRSQACKSNGIRILRIPCLFGAGGGGPWHRAAGGARIARMRTPVLPAAALSVRASPMHGRGVYARVPIAEGTRIVEYRGERITTAEADARYPDDLSAAHHTFLFAVDDDVMIDAAFRGNRARWINHSCDPNCEAVIDDDGRIWIEAIRDISPGEELAYDYNFILPVRHTPAMKKRFPCTCGALACRGTILGKKR